MGVGGGAGRRGGSVAGSARWLRAGRRMRSCRAARGRGMADRGAGRGGRRQRAHLATALERHISNVGRADRR
jgi:hypothetical protein